MRYRSLFIVATVLWHLLPAAAQPSADAALTLSEAWRLAETANPEIRSRIAQVAAAQGERTDARALLYNNPQLSVGRRRRSVSQALPAAPEAQRHSEWDAGVSQTFEIAGQRGFRRDATSAALDALRSEIEVVRNGVRAEVAAQFYRVLALQQRIDLETKALELFDSTAAAVRRRRAAGEDTKLDANVALVEAERARNQRAQAQEQLLEARARLAALLQLPADRLPQARGQLGPGPRSYRLSDLVQALAAQPRLKALAARENSASARLKLESARVYPDITVGLNVGREGPAQGRERLTTLSVSIPLPLFNRNASGIGRATSDLTQVQIERETSVRDLNAQVLELWARLMSQEARVKRLQESVLPTLDDNQQLAAKSRRAGQIGLLELIVVNRQALDARRDLLDALTEYHATRAALERTAGWASEGINP